MSGLILSFSVNFHFRRVLSEGYTRHFRFRVVITCTVEPRFQVFYLDNNFCGVDFLRVSSRSLEDLFLP